MCLCVRVEDNTKGLAFNIDEAVWRLLWAKSERASSTHFYIFGQPTCPLFPLPFPFLCLYISFITVPVIKNHT